jgi:Zn-dependent peptidase ImmA (M78 family)
MATQTLDTTLYAEDVTSPEYSDPEEAAERLRDELWGEVIPVDPAQIAQALGLQVFTMQLSSDVAGALVKQAGNDPRIYLNGADAANRKRFTCAHEIGHFVRRSGGEEAYEYFDFRDSFSATGMDASERFSNAFAAALLMPRKQVERMKKDGLREIEMAVRFGVSREAMHLRLVNLGLI